MVTWLLGLVLAVSVAHGAEPPEQSLIYYNARMALREGQPEESVRLWLLRNAVESRTHRISPHDADFGSVLWAALGELGICQDSVRPDEDGAGLWPIAMHNRLVRKANRRPTPRDNDFRAFAVGLQQRRVAASSVLDRHELSNLRLADGPCMGPWVQARRLDFLPSGDGDKPLGQTRLLLHLLELTRETLDTERVSGMAAVEARRFDLNLRIMELVAREARREVGSSIGPGRWIGREAFGWDPTADRLAAQELRAQASANAILEAAPHWPVSEWMSLSADRRQFVFDRARAHGADPEQLRQVALGILDALVQAGEGAEAEQWIARFDGDPAEIWSGERGRHLLALDPASGFRERAVLALHRAVRLLEEGDARGALNSFAVALREAENSRASEDVRGLARRWTSYVASRYESTEELLTVLQSQLPPPDFAPVLEDLMWSAAFRADRASFDRGLARPGGRGALSRRLANLRPLAEGHSTRFTDQIGRQLDRSPSEVFRFLDEFVTRLEREEPGVREAQAGTLWRLRETVRPIVARTATPNRVQRQAEEFLLRTQALLPEATEHVDDRARALGPRGEVFAGNIRVAPTDPLPWPFAASAVSAPSVLEPLRLIPVEWRDASGQLVFGWRIEG